MSLPEEENASSEAAQQSPEVSNSLNSIAPSGVFEKMFKMPVVRQFKQKMQPAELRPENLFVKMPTTLESADTVNSMESSNYNEPTEAFVVRHLKPGTTRESISSSHFYHDVAAIELSLYTNYLKDELSLEELVRVKKLKNHYKTQPIDCVN